jgi:hypothetical protein
MKAVNRIAKTMQQDAAAITHNGQTAAQNMHAGSAVFTMICASVQP